MSPILCSAIRVSLFSVLSSWSGSTRMTAASSSPRTKASPKLSPKRAPKCEKRSGVRDVFEKCPDACGLVDTVQTQFPRQRSLGRSEGVAGNRHICLGMTFLANLFPHQHRSTTKTAPLDALLFGVLTSYLASSTGFCSCSPIRDQYKSPVPSTRHGTTPALEFTPQSNADNGMDLSIGMYAIR